MVLWEKQFWNVTTVPVAMSSCWASFQPRLTLWWCCYAGEYPTLTCMSFNLFLSSLSKRVFNFSLSFILFPLVAFKLRNSFLLGVVSFNPFVPEVVPLTSQTSSGIRRSKIYNQDSLRGLTGLTHSLLRDFRTTPVDK